MKDSRQKRIVALGIPIAILLAFAFGYDFAGVRIYPNASPDSDFRRAGLFCQPRPTCIRNKTD